MTFDEASRLLDELKDGATYPTRLINTALWVTGDLDAYEALRGTGVDSAVQSKSIGRWRPGSKFVVAQNDSRH